MFIAKFAKDADLNNVGECHETRRLEHITGTISIDNWEAGKQMDHDIQWLNKHCAAWMTSGKNLKCQLQNLAAEK